jgi:hypothetical protein
MKPTKDIKQFISNIADKNYSQANVSLQKMIENKLKERIQSTLSLKK